MHQADDPRPAPADRELQVPADKDLHVAGVVHDANQMLAVISGRAELLLRRAPEHREHLEAIRLAAADAAAMLGRLRGDPVARPATGAAPVGSVIDEAALLVIPAGGRWAAADADPGAGTWILERNVAPGARAALPPAVLREVLVNLFANALAVLPGGGRIAVEAACDGRECRLSVADSGPGLPVEDPEAVFHAGFTTSGRAGRGIGLAACRQLLAAHGATLSATCRGGSGGAVFTIVAPACGTPTGLQGPAAAPVGGRAPLAAPAEGLAVLVIDDEPAVREMLADVLAELGCRVTCHRDGGLALAAGAPGDAALALVDCRLPGLDGPTVVTRLRERAPGLVVALMTGWDRDQDLPPAGCSDFMLRKPLAMDALQDLLARADVLRRQRGAEPGTDAGGTA